MERAWKSIKTKLDKGDYYDAYQLLLSRISRLPPSESLNIGLEKAKIFAEYGSSDVACYICCHVIKVARENGIKSDIKGIDNIMDILKLCKSSPERSKLLNEALLWCKVSNMNEGEDILHKWASNIYYKEGIYHKAQGHVIFIDDADLYVDILLKWQEMGYKSEKELFVLRAVLILLSLPKLNYARELLDKYCLINGYLININNLEQNNINKIINKKPPSPIQLAFLIVSTCELSDKYLGLDFMDIIKRKYALILRRDPLFNKLIEKIEQNILGKVSNQTRGILTNLLSMFSNGTTESK
ncbi:uncharacterized protein CMU_027360 [Cryptosporidium muris RN66]|uniref:Uncharacterized protein n=1 Tax=Cryptosporidium muris (strain RN66) TaxID=441375 RepID=B6ABH4_CRYMR|nr:uncharacterized protein CMU_027360 [Cryptosporidium muris RN66]EEA05726.1 hypothetical protein, conserved [Cryptosporidium muris RN66]|eukprot:XP_002140075.1 hypothetical protein [Cryptosporidium muris RN66]